MRTILSVLVFILGTFPTLAAEPSPWSFRGEELQPFWGSGKMYGESVLFVRDGDDSQAIATLAITPTRIVSVCSSSGEKTYAAGTDFVWKPGCSEIALPPGSAIVCKAPQDLRRPAGSQRHRLTHRDGNGEILFGASHEYHDMQTVVTYEFDPAEWAGPKTAYAGEQLPRTIKKLSEKQPLTIALLGDSISTGCNASGWAGTAPFLPPYQELLRRNLEKTYGGEVALKNFSVSGKDTGWGLAVIGQVIEAKPDLVILAFGMNDAARRPAAEYQDITQKMIDAVREKCPETEFILIATMLGNKDWITLKHELFSQYRDALQELAGAGIAVADMTSLWDELLKHKRYWDMTGNGVNHPNDFGHRLYAQVLSALLIPER